MGNELDNSRKHSRCRFPGGSSAGHISSQFINGGKGLSVPAVSLEGQDLEVKGDDLSDLGRRGGDGCGIDSFFCLHRVQ